MWRLSPIDAPQLTHMLKKHLGLRTRFFAPPFSHWQQQMTKPNIDWRNSDARTILLSDLEDGHLPLTEADMSADTAWQFHRQLPEFQQVPKHQFKQRLEDHRKQFNLKLEVHCEEEWALHHDRKSHPKKTHNHRGELAFDVSAAKELLREDVANWVHEKMTPQRPQQTQTEHQLFEPVKFKEHIHQEVRRRKMISCLELQRCLKKQKVDTSRRNQDGRSAKKRGHHDSDDDSD